MAKACSLPGRLFAFEHRVQKLSIQPIHRMIRYHSSSEFQFFAFKLNPISSKVKKMVKACSLPGRLSSCAKIINTTYVHIYRMIRQLSRFEFFVVLSNYKMANFVPDLLPKIYREMTKIKYVQLFRNKKEFKKESGFSNLRFLNQL